MFKFHLAQPPLRAVLGFLALSLLANPRAAFAAGSDSRTLLRSGAWGLAAGTVAGVAALPATRSVRGVFLGSSVGLYLGLAVGAYLLANPGVAEGLVQSASIGEPPDTLSRNPARGSRFEEVALSIPVLRF